jgi:putative transposase
VGHLRVSKWTISQYRNHVVILRHDRRKIEHVAVTQQPAAVWLSHQVTEAFPWDTAPGYLLRDRDGSYGERFSQRVKAMGIKEVLQHRERPGKIPTSSG